MLKRFFQDTPQQEPEFILLLLMGFNDKENRDDWKEVTEPKYIQNTPNYFAKEMMNDYTVKYVEFKIMSAVYRLIRNPNFHAENYN